MESSSAIPASQRIRLGDLEFSLVTREEIFDKAPKDLVDEPLLDPVAPDVSTVPPSHFEEHPVKEGGSDRPRVNLPKPYQEPPEADAEQASGSGSKGKGKEKETETEPPVAPVEPAPRWEPDKVITNKGDHKYYLDIVRSIKRHMVAESDQDIRTAEEDFKAQFTTAGRMIQRGNRKLVAVAILRHIIGNFPKFCNPNVPAGQAASKRLADVVKYMTSRAEGMPKSLRVTVADVDAAVSDFCRAAYPYPRSGPTQIGKASRFRFVCFNSFAFHLASQQLLTGTDLARRAVWEMLGRGYCHESVYVAARWITTTRVGDRLLLLADDGDGDGDDGSGLRKDDLPELYRAFVEYQARYMELIEQGNQPAFRMHKVAVRAAQARIESADPRMQAVEDDTQVFAAVHRFASEQVARGYYGPGNVLMQFRERTEFARRQPPEARQPIMLELMKLVEECKPLLNQGICDNAQRRLMFPPLTH